jgi:2-oxoglutarate/2-oxoacid ferredoxin oxidoreductase subunit alpha
MKKVMKTQILFGGPAGTGPNILTHLLAEALVSQGHYVFYSRDYQSLIRGGHNFNVLTFSNRPVSSNESKHNVIVALDEKTIELHKKNLKNGGEILSGNSQNMYYAGRIYKMLCLDFSILEKQLKILKKRFDENLKTAKQGYDEEKKEICQIKKQQGSFIFENGSQAIAEGALASGLDIYYAYPMTPATPVLTELGQATLNPKNKHKVIELENEIAVANAGVGSSMVGKKVMVGTSGGGFDLMAETLSLCGIAEIPLVFYLSQRPGPGTGVATYTAQGDLHIALNAGHGEFPRMVIAPGDIVESSELTNQIMLLSQKFKTPSIIVSDKHLGESGYTVVEKPKILPIKDKTSMKRYNSYEIDPATGSATEEPALINKEVEKRLAKGKEIAKYVKNFEQYKLFGEKNSENVVVFWGSVKGAILDAISDLNVCALQILYLEPFPEEIKKYLEGKNVILVENNATGLLSKLIREKTGIVIEDKNKILRYDGRPFLSDELEEELKKRGVKG